MDLYENGLTGSIPAELGNLANLEVLYLRSNGLSGPVPAELGNLSNLVYLSLGSNELSGPVPAELGNLSNLVRLYLYENGLTGSIPVELGNLANLEVLSLRSNGLSGPIPAELGNLANLEVLNLRSNGLSGPIPAELGNLSNLVRLYLYENGLTGPIPPELGDLASLEILNLGFNELTGLLPESFLELDALRLFNFGGNAGLCVPNTAAFVTWLESIENASGPFCQSAGGPQVGGTYAGPATIVAAADGVSLELEGFVEMVVVQSGARLTINTQMTIFGTRVSSPAVTGTIDGAGRVTFSGDGHLGWLYGDDEDCPGGIASASSETLSFSGSTATWMLTLVYSDTSCGTTTTQATLTRQ